MGRGKRWSRRELLLALHLYERIEFGKQHRTNPDVIALAQVLGRTPDSVAMKLGNLTSLDPLERARDIKGLPGASELDRMLWAEFHGSMKTPAEAEELWQAAFPVKKQPVDEQIREKVFEKGRTETTARVKVRRAQQYFRRVVLAIYGSRCCITELPVRSLLAASHIVPWARDEANRMNPRNGLCLARTQDAAFDRGLITFDTDLRLVVGAKLRGLYREPAVHANFAVHEGRRLRDPVKSLPDPAFLDWHRRERFKG